MFSRWVVCLVVFVGLASGCAASRDSSLTDTSELTKATAQGDFQGAIAEGDGHWEGRMERSNLESAIASWEKATTLAGEGMSDDERRVALAEVYAKISRGYYFLADGHIRMSEGDADAIEEEMKETFEKGVTAGEKSLAVYSPEVAKEMADGNYEAVSKLDKGAVPGLYWFATNMGKWALIEGFGTILKHKDDIKAVMDFIKASDPTYFHGAADRYFGAYYAKLPGFAGGDLNLSMEHFQKSLAADPDWLSTYVLIAELHSTKSDDKAAFKEWLQKVIDYDISGRPEMLPENEFEKRKARRLLTQVDELF